MRLGQRFELVDKAASVLFRAVRALGQYWHSLCERRQFSLCRKERLLLLGATARSTNSVQAVYNERRSKNMDLSKRAKDLSRPTLSFTEMKSITSSPAPSVVSSHSSQTPSPCYTSSQNSSIFSFATTTTSTATTVSVSSDLEILSDFGTGITGANATVASSSSGSTLKRTWRERSPKSAADTASTKSRKLETSVTMAEAIVPVRPPHQPHRCVVFHNIIRSCQLSVCRSDISRCQRSVFSSASGRRKFLCWRTMALFHKNSNAI